jgi:hypothetical protein
VYVLVADFVISGFVYFPSSSFLYMRARICIQGLFALFTLFTRQIELGLCVLFIIRSLQVVPPPDPSFS